MKNSFGYKTIQLKTKLSEHTFHTLLAKEHSIRIKDPTKPLGRTMFLLNVPPYITDENLIYGFKDAGEIISVIFADSVNPEDTYQTENDIFTTKKKLFQFKYAYIVFKSSKSLNDALKQNMLTLYSSEKHTVIESGLEKWTKQYLDNINDEEVLQKEIDQYMKLYDAKEQKILDAEKSTKPDEDGWIKVTKRGRNAGFEQKESVINKLDAKIAKDKKKKELKNFYTFQIRESKMQNIISLRKKFDEDRKKIEALKKTRKFKPFN